MLRRHELCARAITRTLFAPITLPQALARLGFVQADPIRAPARAQDLILRQRVTGYRAGMLEQQYGALGIEEDYVYAYGFVTRAVWQLLHPRSIAGRMPALDKKVLALVQAADAIHPRELDAHLGRARVLNAWGGYSQATKRALERLHQRGLVRVARRERGVRVYAAAPPLAPSHTSAAADARLSQLAVAVANVLAPVPERTLQSIVARMRRHMLKARPAKAQLAQLVADGVLVRNALDGVSYLWPGSDPPPGEVPRRVRMLAPFDPLVWDRTRFEQLWGWPYRFEAYTPVHKRVRGYYALPLLWCDRVVGWANASTASGALEVSVGFASGAPRERDFKAELEAEIGRLEAFLRPLAA
jgi:uncharacterized protein